MFYKNFCNTSFSRQEILQKLQFISSRKKIKMIDIQTFSLYIWGIANIYRAKSNYRVKIVIKETFENKNNICIIVYPDFVFYSISAFLLFGLIDSIYRHGFQINWYFWGIYIFFVYLNIYEFLEQRKGIINKITNKLNNDIN